ncbi:unnamed protein product [Brassica oleracea var. botrytis]|uniref:Uncharacterized protein n=2 Tax=Brassica oleracea TaxID=3712 RepID=A0A0D3BMC5_BRAOL|nr:unnamed protein product [Brassica oleracea]
MEAEAYGSVKARFFEKLGNGVLEARFRKLPQDSDSDSDSGSEAGSGRPMKLPCNNAMSMKVISITFKSIYDPQRVGRRQGKRDISRNTERTHPTRPLGERGELPSHVPPPSGSAWAWAFLNEIRESLEEEVSELNFPRSPRDSRLRAAAVAGSGSSPSL